MHTFFTVCCEFVLANDDQFFDDGKLDVATPLSIALFLGKSLKNANVKGMLPRWILPRWILQTGILNIVL